MAATKKKRTKKGARPAKAGKASAKKSKAKKAARRAARKPARKRATKAAASRAPAKKKKQTVGEGDYAASRSFLKDEASFVARHKASIPSMGRAAEKALEGPEGDALREAEATAAARSRDTF